MISHALLHHGEIGGVAAEIAEVGAAHRQKIALGVERQLGLHRKIARLIVGQKQLVALDDPFHRAPELFRRPRHQRELGIDHAAGAEIAADIAHEHADFVRRHAEDGGEVFLEPHRAAIAGIDRIAAGLGIERRQRGARLHRHAGHALHPGFEPRHMRGTGERRCRSLRHRQARRRGRRSTAPPRGRAAHPAAPPRWSRPRPAKPRNRSRRVRRRPSPR